MPSETANLARQMTTYIQANPAESANFLALLCSHALNTADPRQLREMARWLPDQDVMGYSLQCALEHRAEEADPRHTPQPSAPRSQAQGWWGLGPK